MHQELLDLKQKRPGGVQIVEQIRKQANDVIFFLSFFPLTFELSWICTGFVELLVRLSDFELFLY
jgi:hypothetical protein